ncbi:MAG: hypothetical protein ACKO01_09585 [Erythrobacter sp.]
MTRQIGAVLAGVVFFAAFVVVLNRLAIASWPAYAAAFEADRFTFLMMVARLCIGAAGLLGAGFIVALIAPQAPIAIIMAAALLLLLGGSIHLHEPTWSSFPLWYHLAFIGSIVPAVLIGGRLRR